MEILNQIDQEITREDMRFSMPNVYISIPSSDYLILGTLQIFSRPSNVFIYWLPTVKSSKIKCIQMCNEKLLDKNNSQNKLNSPDDTSFHNYEISLDDGKFIRDRIFTLAKFGYYSAIHKLDLKFEFRHIKKKIFTFNKKRNIIASRVTIINNDDLFTFVDFTDVNFAKKFKKRIKSLVLLKKIQNKPETYVCETAKEKEDNNPSSLDILKFSTLLEEINFMNTENQYDFSKELKLYDTLYSPKVLPEVMNKNIKTDSKITLENWKKYFNEDGVVISLETMKSDIHKFGISTEIRLEAYKHILGYYQAGHTRSQRENYDKSQRIAYDNLCSSWERMKAYNESMKYTNHSEAVIKIDVPRCGLSDLSMAHEPYFGQVYRILTAHLIYDPKLEYDQVMSHFVAKLLHCFKNENDTFWCFAYLIKLKRILYLDDRIPMVFVKYTTKYLIHFLCPNFYHNFAKNESLFDDTIIDTWLKQDCMANFDIADILRIWEVSWTSPNPLYYYIFFIVAIILNKSKEIIDNLWIRAEEIRACYKKDKMMECSILLERTDFLINEVKKFNNLPDVLKELFYHKLI